MSITISVPEKPILKPKIVVFGVGGGGCNAVNNMIRSDLEGVDFVVANTDAQSLAQNTAERCIQMGAKRTQGLGAGSHPEVGFEAAEEVIGDISDAIHGAHMVFVTAGMGGGTGTGAAPVVARLAKEMGALTVGVVTKPFMFEGNRRMAIAETGIEDMQKYVDTLLIIPNQNLFRVSSEQTALTEAFAMADRVLFSAVAGITNLMVRPGMINLDFADVRTVMGEMGKAMIGTGDAEGEKRGVEAAEHALNNPLLDDVSMKGARGVLISISGDEDMKLYEVEEAANRIRSEIDPDAQIIFGATTDPSLGQTLRVSVVATGIDQQEEMPLAEMDGAKEDSESGSPLEDDLETVGGAEGVSPPAESAPIAINAEAADSSKPRPFRIVSSAPPEAAAPPHADGGLTAIAEERDPPQKIADEIASPPPPPYSAEIGTDSPAAAPDRPHEAAQNGAYNAQGSPQGGSQQSVHPFSPVSGSMSSPMPASAAQVKYHPNRKARPVENRVPDHPPKGLFGRLKDLLHKMVEASESSEASNASEVSNAPPPHNLSSRQPAAEPKDEAKGHSGDDQLEIPSFLKSQAQ